MPELPEVETTVNGLKREVLERTFLDFWTDTPKMIKNVEIDEFKASIKGKKIIDIKRRAKNILLFLSGDLIILIHLKMTGHLLVGKWDYSERERRWISAIDGPRRNDPYNQFIRGIFYLDDGKELALCDLRKFAKIELWKNVDIENGLLNSIGPEPLNENFSLDDFREAFKKKGRGKIKQLLMDQSLIAGIGNIYASEILFEARIHPEEDISKLDQDDFRRMYSAMKEVLKKAIGAGGDSFSDFRNIYGERGNFQNIMKVYSKDGHNCQDCDNIIRRSRLGGRSTFYCPNCQKLKK